MDGVKATYNPGSRVIAYADALSFFEHRSDTIFWSETSGFSVVNFPLREQDFGGPTAHSLCRTESHYEYKYSSSNN